MLENLSFKTNKGVYWNVMFDPIRQKWFVFSTDGRYTGKVEYETRHDAMKFVRSKVRLQFATRKPPAYWNPPKNIIFTKIL